MLYKLTALELRDAFCRGDVTAVQIAEHFLKRIEKHDGKIGSFLLTLGPRVLLKAEALDRKRKQNLPVGKLAAIPIAIKDNMHILHETTTCGSKFMQNYRAPFEATVVRLLEEEDALLLGKTNLDEFSMGSSNEKSAYCPVQNPWNIKCVPGGSSGGSAAAVSAKFSLLATGSDTGGSIRQPASFCGIVGFKPTYGRVSRYGLVAFGSSLDQIGPFATTVADAALAMEVMGSHCTYDATSLDLPNETYPLSKELEEGTVIGVPWDFLQNLNPEARHNFEEAVHVYKQLGAKIINVNLDILRYSIAVYYILATAEASTNLARLDGILYGTRSKKAATLDEVYKLSRQEYFGREVKKRIMLGTYVLSAGFQDAFYKKAQKVRTLIMDAFDEAFNECDAVMMPVTTSGAFEKGSFQDPLQMYLQDIFTVPANLAGIPGISVPSGYDKRGMPLGLQLLGPQMCDVSLMQIAYAYEQATKFYRIPRDYE